MTTAPTRCCSSSLVFFQLTGTISPRPLLRSSEAAACSRLCDKVVHVRELGNAAEVPRYTALNQPRPQNTVRNHRVYIGLENVAAVIIGIQM